MARCKGRGPEVFRNLDRAAKAASIDARLRGFLDHSADQDGQFRRAVEDQHAVVCQQHRRNSRRDRP